MIVDTTTGKVISHQERICTTFFSQLRGLMFRRRENVVMIFPKERIISLHMFFVFYPIDVLIVDEKMRIVEWKRNLRPWRVWSSPQKGKYVVELGAARKDHEGVITPFRNGMTLEFL